MKLAGGVGALLLCAAVESMRAQNQLVLTVNGIAYDSLRGAPLSGAFVAIAGTTRTTTTDTRGQFRFELAPGRYTFVLHTMSWRFLH